MTGTELSIRQLKLNLQQLELSAKLGGMQAANDLRKLRNEYPDHTEDEFEALVEELRTLGQEAASLLQEYEESKTLGDMKKL